MVPVYKRMINAKSRALIAKQIMEMAPKKLLIERKSRVRLIE